MSSSVNISKHLFGFDKAILSIIIGNPSFDVLYKPLAYISFISELNFLLAILLKS